MSVTPSSLNEELLKTAVLSFAVASIAFTVAEMKIFAPFRSWASGKGKFLSELFSCCYCLGHWVSFVLVAIYRPRILDSWIFLDLFLTALAIAWLAALQCLLMCRLMDLAGK